MRGEPANPILVLAPRGRDANLASEALSAGGLRAQTCSSVEELCRSIPEKAAAAIVAEEALTTPAVTHLLASLAAQPPWSDFPIVLLGEPPGGARRMRRDRRLLDQANVTILERPFGMRTLLAAARSALRSHQRQLEARNAIRNRDQFLAMLGHELRNPLATILLALEAATVRPGGLAPAQVGVMDRQARRLARLVDDLLDVSRVTSGKVRLRCQRVEVQEIVARTTEAMAAQAAEGGVRLVMDSVGPPLQVHADPVRLEQVLTNLVANAIKFTPFGGEVRCLIRGEPDHARITVRDTGAGIPPDALERIFELFAQVDTTIDRSRGGLGIGLTLAKSLVELHGGTITAASPGVGLGAEFCLRLPLSSRPEQPPPPPVRPAGRRVAVVEDNADLRAGFRLLLELSGHDVVEAGTGPAGVEAILQERPAVAFVDLGLPGFDGFELARRVRAAGGPTRLVAATGYGQPEDRQRALDAGFDDHMTKPLDMDAVRRILGVRERRDGPTAARMAAPATATVAALPE